MKKAILINLYIGISILCCLTSYAQSLRVGFTRIETIIAQMPESKQVENQLTIQQTQAGNEAKRLQKEFDEKYDAYQKTGAQLTEAVRKDRETELRNLQTRIQEFGRSTQESLQNKYKQLMGPILSKVQQAIDTVAKQTGYHYILNVSTTNSNILYAAEENNVTELVLKRLGIAPGQATEKSTKTLSKSVNPTPKKK